MLFFSILKASPAIIVIPPSLSPKKSVNLRFEIKEAPNNEA